MPVADVPPALVSEAAPAPVDRPWRMVGPGHGPGRRDLVVVVSSRTAAQSPAPAAPAPASPRPSSPGAADRSGAPLRQQWMVGGGHAWSVGVFQSEGGRQYVPITLSWARDLTRDAGPGWLRGRLAWAVEVMPLYGQHAPSRTLGVGVSPLLWRWQFVPRRRVAAYAELAFGGLFTRDPVPEETTRTNFLTHGTFGVRWRPGARVSPVTAYRFQHVSNGNAQVRNPGVNAHVLWVGVAVTGR